MKRFWIPMVVASMASAAFGGIASFTLPAQTDTSACGSVSIPVSVSNSGVTDAMVLFAEVTGPFRLIGMELGPVWEGNSVGLYREIYGPQNGYLSIETVSGKISLQPGSVLAWLIVACNPWPVGEYGGTISTSSIDGASELGWDNAGIGQATGSLRYDVPEPVSALLLLAGLPLLHRRRK